MPPAGETSHTAIRSFSHRKNCIKLSYTYSRHDCVRCAQLVVVLSRFSATTRCDYFFYCSSLFIKEHNRGYIKGSIVLCLLKNVRSGFCISSVGGSPAPLIALRLRFAAGLPPTIRLLSSWLTRSTLAFHSSGGLTAADSAPLQFLPLRPFLALAPGLLGVLPHVAPKRSSRGTAPSSFPFSTF
jgi:hypothetical protein